MKALASAPRALTPLALAAAALAIVVPSAAVARHSDVLLALLVLLTALGFTAAELRDDVRRHAIAIAVLSVAPVAVLSLVAWAIGRAFDAVSPRRPAGGGSGELGGGDRRPRHPRRRRRHRCARRGGGLALVAALLGPVALGVLAGHAGHVGTAHLLGRFAVVVIAPLAVGVAVRSAAPLTRALRATDAEREGLAAITVAALVYAALSGTAGHDGLGGALLASCAFLAVTAVLAELWRRAAPAPVAVPGALAIAMRDFAVAAALAAQAFGTRAAVVPGVYGVVMLLAGSTAAGLLGARRVTSTA